MNNRLRRLPALFGFTDSCACVSCKLGLFLPQSHPSDTYWGHFPVAQCSFVTAVCVHSLSVSSAQTPHQSTANGRRLAMQGTGLVRSCTCLQAAFSATLRAFILSKRSGITLSLYLKLCSAATVLPACSQLLSLSQAKLPPHCSSGTTAVLMGLDMKGRDSSGESVVNACI